MGGAQATEPTKYHSIHEIPDEMVQTWSKRDPDNKVYQTRRWVNFKKKQILYQQNDGIPMHLRTPAGRISYYAIWAATFFTFGYNIYTWNKFTAPKKQ